MRETLRLGPKSRAGAWEVSHMMAYHRRSFLSDYRPSCIAIGVTVWRSVCVFPNLYSHWKKGDQPQINTKTTNDSSHS